MEKLTLKKLWLIRIYILILQVLAELALVLYIFGSLSNMVSDKGATTLGNIILGSAGLIIVVCSLSILFLTQIIQLFVGIHDNIEDIRNKTIHPETIIFENPNKTPSLYSHDFFQAVIIVISLLIILLQFTITSSKGNTSNNIRTEVSTTSALSADNSINAPAPAPAPGGETGRIGDRFDGGIIYWIDASGKHGLIVDNDNLVELTWDEAKRACTQKGTGWRLPTAEEFRS